MAHASDRELESDASTSGDDMSRPLIPNRSSLPQYSSSTHSDQKEMILQTLCHAFSLSVCTDEAYRTCMSVSGADIRREP